jgi:hypothetical protein
MRRTPRPKPRTATTLALLLGAALAIMWLPASAAAAITLVEPISGTHFDDLERAPMVAFDPGVDAQPKWVLLATDPEMKSTVRYCRQFVWAATQNAGLKWGCNRWATGADGQGNDILEPVKPGTTYYWQVVAKTSPTDATEVRSEIRTFTLDPEQQEASIASVSDKIMGTVFDDGTQLNLGAAAYVNSKVKVAMPVAKRLSTYGFRLRVKTSGAINVSKSYIQIKSAAGTRYIKVKKIVGGVQGVYTLNAAERKLKSKRFTYGVMVKSAANGSMVRSRYAVLVIKSVKKKTSPANSGTHIPVWVPD